MSAIIQIIGNLGESLSRFTQRWIPDSWVVCMSLTVLAMLLAMLGAGAGLNETVLAWGGGMWALLELAMQFAIALIAAHACVSSRPAFRFLDWLASRPDEARPVQAVVLLGLFSIVVAYFNWAASVVASALFLPFVARRNPRADVRILIAAGYLGLGTVWHGGLSGSAPPHHGHGRQPHHDAATGGRAPRRPAAAGDRDAVQRLQPRLSRRRLGGRPRHGRPAAPAQERADADRGRAGRDHAVDARGDGARRPRPRASRRSRGGSTSP